MKIEEILLSTPVNDEMEAQCTLTETGNDNVIAEDEFEYNSFCNHDASTPPFDVFSTPTPHIHQ